MAEPNDSLILSILQKVQADISEIKRDISSIKSDVSDTDQKVDGLTVMFALLAGHVHHIETRVPALEAKG